MNQQLPADISARDLRSPTLRETPVYPRSPHRSNDASPDLVRHLVDGYRAQLNEQREKEEKLIQELRSHRTKLDKLLGHILNAVDRMEPATAGPNILQPGHYSPSADVRERAETEFLDAHDLHETIEKDSTQESQENSNTRWIPGREIRTKGLPAPRTSSGQDGGQPPTTPSGRHPVSEAAMPTKPFSKPLPTPTRTPGRKRKRIEEASSSTTGNMGPPLLRKDPLPRKARTASEIKTKRMWEFSDLSSREQSVAILARTAPIISCHCRRLDCVICNPPGEDLAADS
jgi:hypothetical protein